MIQFGIETTYKGIPPRGLYRLCVLINRVLLKGGQYIGKFVGRSALKSDGFPGTFKSAHKRPA